MKGNQAGGIEDSHQLFGIMLPENMFFIGKFLIQLFYDRFRRKRGAGSRQRFLKHKNADVAGTVA